jgi:ribonuclease VapC
VTLVVDSSAIMAITIDEPEAATFRQLLKGTAQTLISAGTMVELYRLVQTRFDLSQWPDLERMLQLYRVQIVPVEPLHLTFAKEGMARFGQGRGAPPAVLNFGDLFAYALARSLNAPLLFKGDDFSQTDVIAAWRP